MTASDSLESFKLEYEHGESIEDFKALKAMIRRLKRNKVRS